MLWAKLTEINLSLTFCLYFKINLKLYIFLTAILHRGLRNDLFFVSPIYFFRFLFGLLFSFSIWTFISLFYLNFYFFLGLLFLFRPFYFFFRLLFPFLHKSRSDLGFLPSFFSFFLYSFLSNCGLILDT